MVLRSSTLVGLAVFTSASLAGCATVSLQETTPVKLSASLPEAPPPPPPPPPVVEVEETRIRVDEKIHFEFDSDEISPISEELLREIARVLNENPDVARVRVEGHTDTQGTAEYNLDLSQRRAASVVAALVRYGVDESRLEPAGYGFSKPIADNESEEGRAKNRRVEFNILERDESKKAASADASDEPAEQPTEGGHA